MQSAVKDKHCTVEEYFLLEQTSELRHEFINGNIYEMSGASREHPMLCQNLLFILKDLLRLKGFTVFMENMKVKIPNENKFYYPDILVTKELQNEDNRFMQFAPELLAEVTSEFSRNRDMVDKLIQYQKFPSLKYYLILEIEKHEIILVSRNNEGGWQSESFSEQSSIITLPALEIKIKTDDLYIS